jgi:predicted nuclease of restriction endonuclease-like (RecB) superfamily
MRKALSKTARLSKTGKTPAISVKPLFEDLRGLILQSRENLAHTVNTGIARLYWEIGSRIRRDILKCKRAKYGAEIVPELASRLSAEFGRGFNSRNIFRMVRFAEVFPDPAIVTALRSQLGWSHFRQLISFDDPLKRDFYAEMCRVERWNTRTLEQKIQGMLFERSALSRKPQKLAALELKKLRDEDRLTPDLVFRDPYFLDFLNLKDTYSESDLESAILREIEGFILELGEGFAFVERQKRIPIDGDDFHLDLLFYHRGLRRLVAIELKLGDFQPGDAGQMQLYLGWLDRYEKKQGEGSPIGLILCAGKKQERIELMNLERERIRVASYWTKLPPKRELEKRLHRAILMARTRLRSKSQP